MKRLTFLAFLALAPVLFGLGCNAPEGKTKQDKQDFVMKMHDETLNMFYSKKPDLEEKIKNAPGYAVFSNTNVTFIFVGGGGGYGVAIDTKQGGKKTYMKMTSGNIGLGLGAKDFRGLFIFNKEAALLKFLAGQWGVGAEADATATSGTDGGTANAAAKSGKAVDFYQYTDSGVMLQATVGGSKFSRDNDLN